MYKNHVPRLADIQGGLNQVTIVHKDSDGWWVVRQPFAIYPIRYTEWETAIQFAFSVGTVYTDAETPMVSSLSKVMINRRNVQTHE